jgi:hypothetical protein
MIKKQDGRVGTENELEPELIYSSKKAPFISEPEKERKKTIEEERHICPGVDQV